jgi:precorrin-6A synthase
MRRVLVIGIGAGNPEHLTLQAIDALNRVDAIFLMDKGAAKAKLIALREEICRRHVTRPHRLVHADSPEWTRGTADYGATIDALNRDKGALFERLITDALADGECGAFLVWGDPALYDSTIRILETIAARGTVAFAYEVIPGISSVQALTARHRIPLNRIGQSVAITTGRRLAEAWPDADTVVVMLDAHNSFQRYVDQDIDIWWGAYVGTPDEIVIAGRLREVADEIVRVRAAARHANGWIMDSYVMRRRAAASDVDED